MDLSRLLKWIVLVVLALIAWKYLAPWVTKQMHRTSAASTSGATGTSCVNAAQQASEKWGSGIGRFANPPYDIQAWSSFTEGVKLSIATAESACGDSTESCVKARSSMADLRTLVSDLDSAIRTGSAPPGDVVQRQESIDTRIDEARELVRAGK